MPETKQPLVTVITSAYKHGAYIAQAVQSVIDQTFENWEYIVLDDASGDDTAEVLAQFSHDPRIRVVLGQTNRGQSHRMNQGIDLARGEFIAILPSDDWYLPDKLKLQVEKFRQLDDSFGVVYGAGLRYFEDRDETLPATTNGLMQRGWILEALLTGPFFIYPITPMFRKSCFDDCRFDESYRAEGEAIHFKLAIHHQYDFVEQPLAVMRQHDFNTGGRIQMMLDDNIRYREELFAQPDFPAQLKPLLPQIKARIYKLKGWELIRIAGDYRAGRKALWQALRCRPTLLFDKRVISGLCLSILPSALADRLNRAVTRANNTSGGTA